MSAEKVVALNDIAALYQERRQRQPVPDVIMALEDALAEARAGALRAVVIVGAWQGAESSDTACHRWCATGAASGMDGVLIEHGLAVEHATLVKECIVSQ